MDSVAYTMRVSGLVQGVGFRWSTKMVADELGVRGNVANQADGSVVIHALATPTVMAKFKKAIKDSPTPYGRVSSYEETPIQPLPSYDSFDVIA
ncbi:acylphosphatase [Lacticaseibacillus zhaodongensis]|uniref:acylphosphatase n=1 Tax=Lacticaseibacillus zhaodongensis TaxID=2668065 RepID=UPI0012D2E071|nr:acylphosphatase [Lacticaseibacillus zhaodongensis]